jgi:hypothetical protein
MGQNDDIIHDDNKIPEGDFEKLKLRAEIRKIEADESKLRFEEEVMRRPWFKQTTFLNLLITILIPLLTILLGYYFGGKEYFDAEKRNLDADNKLLEYRKEKLQDDIKKDSINRNKLRAENKNLKLENEKSSAESEKFHEKVILLETHSRTLTKSIGKKTDSLNLLRLSEFQAYLTEFFKLDPTGQDGFWCYTDRPFSNLLDNLKIKADRDKIEISKLKVGDEHLSSIKRCALISALYAVTQDTHYYELFSENISKDLDDCNRTLACTNSSNAITTYNYLVNASYWSERQRKQLKSILLRKMTIGKVFSYPPPLAIDYIIYSKCEAAKADVEYSTSSDRSPEDLLNLLAVLRKSYTGIGNDSIPNSAPFFQSNYCVFDFSPMVFLCYASYLIDEKQIPEDQVLSNYAASKEISLKIFFKKYLSTPLQIKQFVKDNQDTYNHLMELDFSTYKSNLTLIKSELSKYSSTK